VDWAGTARDGHFTKRTAEDWLGSMLDQARRGTLPGMVQTGVTFADAAAEWLRYIEHDRGRKPSTVSGYRSIVGSELLPRFGQMALETITPAAIESWQGSRTQAASTRTKALVLMHGIFQPNAIAPIAEIGADAWCCCADAAGLSGARRHRPALARGWYRTGAAETCSRTPNP